MPRASAHTADGAHARQPERKGTSHGEQSRRRAARRPADPRQAPRGAHHVRRQGSRHGLPAHRAAAAAGGCAERADRPARRRRLRRLERLRRSVRDAHGRAPGRRRTPVQPLPHDRSLLAYSPGPAHRAQPPLRRDGRHHGDRHVRAGLQLDPAEHRRPARGDAQAERLLDGAVRQVPRGSSLGDEPTRAVRRMAQRGRRVRALLRLHRRRDEPVRAGDLRRDGAGGARPLPRGGLPLHRGHDGPGDRLDPTAEGADAGQAVLRLLRPRRDARTASRADRVVGQVQGEVRPGLGRPARGELRAPEGARRDPARGRADRTAGGDSGVGRHARRPQAGARASDGGVRGLPRAHRPSHRPARGRARASSRCSATR